MSFIKKYFITILGSILGSGIGFWYYYNIGCDTGTCAITSKPLNCTFYFALLGGLIFNLFEKKENK